MNSTIPAPNYTQIPNAILDKAHQIDASELRVLLAVARQTFGWHKETDIISIARLMTLTGLSRQSVLNGISAAMSRGFLDRTAAGTSFSYHLVVYSLDRPVQELDMSKNYTDQSGLTIRPEAVQSLDRQPVYSLDTQKKGLKKLKDKQLEQQSASTDDDMTDEEVNAAADALILKFKRDQRNGY